MCRGDRQHAGACAQIEHRIEPARAAGACAHHPLDHFQTACGGAMMPCAKGLAGLELDGQVICPYGLPVMGAMHQKAPGADGLEAFK